ncbi:uncharacterized protein [Antedon mediterranea]|uniref:uncharacterized protein n=1 Tax=Antedon mediterranea TaxID=105859 RepID=UPI003AF45415
MSKQAMCFDTLTTVSQCTNFPTLSLPKLPDMPRVSTRGGGIDVPEVYNDTGDVATLQDDDNTMTIVGVVTTILMMAAIAGLVYIIYRHKRKKTNKQKEPKPTAI